MALAISEATAELATSSNGTSYTIGAGFTTTPNSMVVVMVFATGTVAAVNSPPDTTSSNTLKDTGGIVFRQLTRIAYNGGTDTAYLFVGRTGPSAVTCTPTFDCNADGATGVVMMIWQVTGTNVEVVQFDAETRTGANPTCTMPAAMDTNNAYIAGFGVPRNPPTSTPPGSWTEIADTGYAGPASGATGAYRVGGESGSTITFTSASANYAILAIELREANVSGSYSQFTTSTASTTSYAFSVNTPAANSLLAVMVYARASVAASPTLSGGSLTWKLQDSANDGGDAAYLFVANVGDSPPTTPTLTFDCTGDAATGIVVIAQNILGKGNYKALRVVQSKLGTGTGASTQSVTFDDPVKTSSGVSLIKIQEISSWSDSDTPVGFVDTHANIAGLATTFCQAAFKGNGETGSTFTWTTNSANGNWWMFGLEVEIEPTWFESFMPDTPDIRRPMLMAAWQMYFTTGRLFDPPVVAPDKGYVEYPERIVRQTMHASQQQDVPHLPPFPDIRKFQHTKYDGPDRVDRPTMHASRQQDVARQNVFPDPRTQQWSDAEGPEMVRRPTMHSSQQQDVTKVYPRPERRVVFSDAQYPERVTRPMLHASQQLDVTKIYPQPDRTIVFSDAEFPDAVRRPSLPTSHQMHVAALNPFPDRRTVQWSDAEAPDRVARPSFLASAQQHFVLDPYPLSAVAEVVFVAPLMVDQLLPQRRPEGAFVWVQPERAVAFSDAEFPDAVTRPRVHASMQQDVSWQPIQPERSFVFFDAEFPERVIRPSLHASMQQDIPHLFPKPEDVVAFADAYYPDIVVRPRMLVSMQQDVARANVKAERTFVYAEASYPDIVRRPSLHASTQQDVSRANVQPESAVAFSDAIHPVRVLRPMYLTSAQQDAAHANVQPEDVVAFVDAYYVDTVRRPLLHASQQQDVSRANVAPERKLVFSDALFPERVVRPVLLASTQQDIPHLFPKPEDVVAYADAQYPDFVRRPSLHASQQQDVSRAPVQPERSFVFSDALFPERVVRPTMLTSEQLDVARMPVYPDARTVQFSDAIYPERVLRPTLHASAQQDTSRMPPKTDIIVVTYADAIYPERVVRPVLHASQQQDVPKLPPFPDRRTVQWSDAIYPERVLRPSLHTSQQLDVSRQPTKPEDIVAYADALYPDAITRPTMHASRQQDVSRSNVQPERPIVFSDALFPEAVRRPTMHASVQQDIPHLFPKPEDVVAFADAYYADTVTRPRMHASVQQDVSHANVQPERTQALASVDYPERVFRPTLRMGSIVDGTFAPYQVTKLTEFVSYPERVLRPSLHASQQQDRAFWPFPISVPPLTQINTGYTAYPDRVVRGGAHSYLQQFVTTVPPFPDRRTVQFSDAIYPERVFRPSFRPVDQQSTAESRQPERKVIFSGALFPDRVTRPVLHASMQQDIPHLFPKPEDVVAYADAGYPDLVRRPQLHASMQQDIPHLFPKPEDVVAYADAIFPDAVLRPRMHASVQQVVPQLPPFPDQRTVQFSGAIYPDFVHRARAQHVPPAFVRVAPFDRPVLAEAPDHVTRPRAYQDPTPSSFMFESTIVPIPSVEAPVRVVRPRASHATTAEAPFDNQPSEFLQALAPEFVRRVPITPGYETRSPEPPPPIVVPDYSAPLYPDSVRRPWLHPSVVQQLSWGVVPLPNPPPFASPRGAEGHLSPIGHASGGTDPIERAATGQMITLRRAASTTGTVPVKKAGKGEE